MRRIEGLVSHYVPSKNLDYHTHKIDQNTPDKNIFRAQERVASHFNWKLSKIAYAWHTLADQSLNETPPFCLSRENDKRPCSMPFNSRTDIRRVDQGPMEIFDETSRKKKQVPMPSDATEEGILRDADAGNDSRQCQISKYIIEIENVECMNKM